MEWSVADDSFDSEDFLKGKERPGDTRAIEATKQLKAFFDEHRQQVSFSRQAEMLHEDKYFH